MKRILWGTLFLGSILLSRYAQADSPLESEFPVLWWQIDSQNTIEFDYALLYATTGWVDDMDQARLIGGIMGGSWEEGGDPGISSGPFLMSDRQYSELAIDNYASLNFFVELVRSDESGMAMRVGVSNTASYSDLFASGHIMQEGLSIPANMVVWTPTTYVPEPSSGLLLLFGVPLLALRRKRNA